MKRRIYAVKIKKCMKAVGLFSGPVNDRVTEEYTEAVRKMQDMYFRRKSDRDGIDGPDTLKLARTLYNFRDIKSFKPSEFRCSCGRCTGYPAVVDRQLLLNLQKLRSRYGSITVTSGVRCRWYNSRLAGSSSTSYHMRGKAADIYNRDLTSTRARRDIFIRKWYRMKNAHFAYGNTYNMGNAVHVDVK